MKPAPFAYAQAESVGHAVALLAQGAGDAVLLAGGQSLIPMLRSRLARPTLVVGIGEIERLKAIRPRASRVDIGAMVSHSVFLGWANDNGQQMLAEAAGYIGHPTVRTMGTVAGSLAHGDPSAEWGVVGLALEAICSVEGPDGRRMIAAADLWEGPFTTTLGPGEMITLVSFPLPRKGDGSCFVEVAPRHGDPAVAAVAAVIRLGRYGKISKARIGLGGLAPTPVRSPSVEAALVGLPADSDFSLPAGEVDEDIAPLGDLHGSDFYRRRVAPTIVARAVGGAVARARAAQDEGS
ncbi:MAG: FAD binding domain-containing protein [Gemmatimonadota bacterium]|nr:FAD binding domain-containing protein [Gemmatimonadota bacterium]